MSGLPDNVSLFRDLGELDEISIPAGLLKDHSLKEGVWGRLEMLAGSLRFVWAAGEPSGRILSAGDTMIIPPTKLHHLELDGDFKLKLALHRENSQV